MTSEDVKCPDCGEYVWKPKLRADKQEGRTPSCSCGRNLSGKV